MKLFLMSIQALLDIILIVSLVVQLGYIGVALSIALIPPMLLLFTILEDIFDEYYS